jgi:thiol-disulfide isomerase/thioredoxin
MSDDINGDRRRWLGAAAMTAAGAGLGLFPPVGRRSVPAARLVLAASTENPLESLSGANAWINSPPLSAASLRGKAVLIDFCTYTCINWLRTLPYVRSWANKYTADGLVVIGVHSPEFEFERDLANVRRAVKDVRVDYPVAVDNDFAIWRAFKNQYWPAVYLVDAKGTIRYRHFGEGEYASSERAIQQSLADAGARRIDTQLVSVEGQGIEAAADWASLKSPENYVGYERTRGFASGDAAPDKRRVYAVQAKLGVNQWALAGDWTMKRQSVALNRARGRIVCHFHARDAHLVMGPASRGITVRFRLRIDGQVPGVARGSDVDEQGNGTVSEQRLYQLIRQPTPITDRQLEIEFLDSGVEAFAFTFG